MDSIDKKKKKIKEGEFSSVVKERKEREARNIAEASARVAKKKKKSKQ